MQWPFSKSNEKSKAVNDAEKLIRRKADGILNFLRKDILQDDIPAELTVAGGFIRDTIVGAAPKDLDIFIRFTEEDEFERDSHPQEVFYRLLNVFNGEVVKIEGEDGLYSEQSNLLDVLEWYDNMRDIVVRLILHEQSVEEMLDRFDINICKAAYANGEFIYRPEFWSDVESKQVTPLFTHAEGPASSAQRWERINRKMKKVWQPAQKTMMEKATAFTGTSSTSGVFNSFITVDNGQTWTLRQ